MLPFIVTLNTQEDIDKLEALYHATSKTLYYYALSLLKNHEAAEDAVQEMYVYISNHMEKIGDPCCKKSANYMLISMKYKIFRTLQNQKQTAADEWEDETVEATEISAEDEVINMESLLHMADGIKALNESYRQILTMRYYLDYSIEEIAEAMGITKDNVSVRLHRAHAALREKLLEQEVNGNA